MAHVDVSVIVVTFNGREFVERSLSSIYANPPRRPFEVLVVDNASHDGTPELVRDRFPEVRLLENPENVGFARANNRAMAACRGGYALLLNSDAEVAAGSVDALWSFMEGRPDVGVAGPRLVNGDGSLQPSGNRIGGIGAEIFWSLPQRSLIGIRPGDRFLERGRDYSKTAEVQEVSGACMIIRRATWETIGLFDEAFFFGYEDLDFCIRARAAGWKVFYLPVATVVHHWGRSSPTTDAVFAGRVLGSRYHFYRKVHGRPFELAMRTATAAKAVALLPFLVLQSLRSPREARAALRVRTRLFLVSIGVLSPWRRERDGTTVRRELRKLG